MAIVLASASPRRKELLEMLRVKDLVILPAEGDEICPAGLSPDETVKALAYAKALEVFDRWQKQPSRREGDVILAADTIVWHRGRILGKPHSREEGFSMLRSLSGNVHEVYTGVVVLSADRAEREAVCSRVTFRELLDREINAYLDTGEPMDKAGAYGAQGIGALFVTAIEGDFYNVMGLPLCTTGRMLHRVGVELL